MKAVLLAIVALVAAALAGWAGAVQELDISSCPGDVTLEQSSSIAVPRLLQGGAAAPAQNRIESVASGWALHCQAAPGGRRAAGAPAQAGQPSQPSQPGKSSVIVSGVIPSVTVNRAINIATGPGAVAVQNIGGKTTVSTGDEYALVKLQVPAGVRIVARSWSGSLQAAPGLWVVNAELASGQMHFSKLHDSTVVVDSGSVSALEATGRLTAHLRGAGSIEVANMRDSALELQLTGAGSMALKGRAASARVLATGAGHIDIEHVTSEPYIQLRGLATVDVGR